MKKFFNFVILVLLVSNSSYAFANSCLSFPRIVEAEKMKPGVHYKFSRDSNCTSEDEFGNCKEGFESHYFDGELSYKYLIINDRGEKTVAKIEVQLYVNTTLYDDGWKYQSSSMGYIPTSEEAKLAVKKVIAEASSDIRTEISKAIYNSGDTVCKDSVYKD